MTATGRGGSIVVMVEDEQPPAPPKNALREYWDALDDYYRDIGMTDDDAHDDWRERVRKFRRP